MAVSIELNNASGHQEISLRAALLAQRNIFIIGEIDDNMAADVIMQLMYLAAESLDPINIYINSPGGSVSSGMAIYDMIQRIACPINMYCTGMAASMAALIFAGGQIGRRNILPHSRVMIHEPYIAGGVGGSVGTIQNTAAEMLRTQKMFNALLAKAAGKKVEEIEQAADHDNFMTAEEAINFGIADQVVDWPLVPDINPEFDENDFPDDDIWL